jgi:hypothetical protein
LLLFAGAKARIVARVTQLKADMPLRELRQARKRSQQDLAREQDVASDQPGLSMHPA